MKKLFLLLLMAFSVTLFAQKKITNQVVDSGCRMCIYKQKSDKGCAMAVNINNKIYTVEGIDKKEFGPMHSDNGYCKVHKKALVSGQIKRGKFYATSFKYVPEAKKD